MRFGDALATRIDLDGRTDEFVVSRTEAWVWDVGAALAARRSWRAARRPARS